ncbi:MAG: hypothetical protein U9R08_02865 [Nanoarchaeota archaeon]|nr:hypothetical protein [Nanoarchaeota archaeon]
MPILERQPFDYSEATQDSNAYPSIVALLNRLGWLVGYDYMKSKNYVSGTSGILLKPITGSAEFQSIIAGTYNKIFRQATAPTASETGDLWFDTDDGNKTYCWSGSAWVDVRDTDIAQAIADAATAQATADGKIVTFIQTTAPTAEGTGDLWMDSDDGYRTYRWSGSAWVDIQDTQIGQALSDAAAAQADATTGIADAATAQAEADRKIITFIQAAAPTAEQTGDIWYDSDDENKVYRWSGSAWVSAQDLAASWALITGANKPDDNADVTASNTALNTTNVNARVSTTFIGFGNGIDGNVTISANTNLTADMYYNNLTIDSGKILYTKGYKIFAKGTITNNGIIDFTGNAGSNGLAGGAGNTGGAGGTAVSNGTIRGSRAGSSGGDGVHTGAGGAAGVVGTAENPSIGSNGSAGGKGGDQTPGGSGKAGGAAGSATAEKLLYKILELSDDLTAGSEDTVSVSGIWETPIPQGRTSEETCSTSAGSGGGGGGYATGPSGSGGGGGGAGATGGCMFISAAILINNGTIRANGGNGGNGGDGYSAQWGSGGGGGAGGSGGAIILIYETITLGTVQVNGGTGGTGGTKYGATNENGVNGTAGVTGKIYKLKKA